LNPQLTLARTNNVLTLSWPVTFPTWVLDTTPTLAGNPPPWTQIPAAQYLTNLTTIFISTTQSSGNAFFRLRKL
jgi:hypothetical protein